MEIRQLTLKRELQQNSSFPVELHQTWFGASFRDKITIVRKGFHGVDLGLRALPFENHFFAARQLNNAAIGELFALRDREQDVVIFQDPTIPRGQRRTPCDLAIARNNARFSAS